MSLADSQSPIPSAIRSAREQAGLTQTRAAAVIYKKLRTWQDWESGKNSMDAAFFELFLLKTGQKKFAKNA
jgi:DNA-binding transcriptional regulator YiaG